MKRIIINLSKLFSIIISVFGLLVSCQEEIEIPEEYTVIAQHFKQVTFEAITGDVTGSTRTIRNEDGSLSWLPNDEINVFCGQDISGRFISNNTEIADRTTFTGHFNADIPETSTPDYWAVYPYQSTNSSDGNSVTLTVPSIQVSSPGTFGAGMFPSVAKSNSTSLAFYNVCGSIKFTLSRDDIDMITLVSNGGEPLAGSVRVTFGTDGKPVAQALEGVSEVTLRPSSGNCFEQGEYYYMTVLPVTMSHGFTMTFHTIDGEEGTIESSNVVTIKRSASSKRDNLDKYVANWHDTGSGQDFSETGVYLGILAFNQALYTCPVSLLTPESLSTVNTFIDNLQMKNGSTLYYAVDNGLSNMQQGESPISLASASLITFTDGLDQGSLMMNPDYSTEDRYLSAVSSRIRNGNVFGLPLSAFSIGIRGNDVQNTEKFRNNLVQLASSEANAYEISDMSELNTRFEQIANSVSVSIDYSHDISLTIPGLPDGTRVRFTFDNVSDASNSNLYIEGTFNLQTRMLSNVQYNGLTSRSGPSVAGTVNDIFIKYDFQKVRRNDGNELSGDYIQQWQYASGGSNWQKNSEFDSNTDTDISVSVSRKSAIIYLVLDCSSSLGSQFSTMKQYAKNFIWKLYNDSYIETSVQSVKLSASELSVEKGKTAKLSANIYPVTALDRSVTWSSDSPSVATVSPEGIVSGISAGSTYIRVRTNDGSRTASCIVTVFEQPEASQGQSSFSQSGLYVGVLAFNQGLYRYPICRLTEMNVESICSFIDNNPIRNGSLVYYSVDEAISEIAIPDYPSDLANAALVTFTDCLDQGSLMKRSYTSNDQYLAAIKQRIGSARVESLPLTSYSIGIRGSDVSDISGYKTNLEKLASSATNAYEITNISSLQSKLNDIADVVSVEHTYTYSCNLTVTIPGVGNGTRVRFTFDNVGNAEGSKLYIEGTFNLGTRALTNIVYEGFSSTPSLTVSGSVDGIFVTYRFSGLQKSDKSELTTGYMKEWTSDNGSSNWQVNSEFDNNNDASTEVSTSISRKSAVVYLVLDFSTSIGSQSSSMKSAAKSFIRNLQKKSQDPFTITSIALNKTSLSLNEGESEQLVVTIIPENATDKSLIWTSSDESIATVDENGKVTAVSKGKATITATACDGSGKSASCSVTVKRLVSSITLDKTSLIIHNSETVKLIASVIPDTANNTAITWTSSDPSVASVSSSGAITGKSRGKTTITATAKDDSGVWAACEVEVLQYVTGISMDQASLFLWEGTTACISVSVLPDDASDKSLNWISSDESVATVDSEGMVTAISEGQTTIMVAASDGSRITQSCCVFVYSIQPSEAIDLGLSVRWASCNLGTIEQGGYGVYIAWGETSPYDESTYKWSPNNGYTKYCTNPSYGQDGFTDGKTVLDSEDDVVHVILGGNWRMPTIAECKELIDNCSATWTTQYGVKGMLMKSKINGNSVFFPAGGNRDPMNYGHDGVGIDGYYWSSSLKDIYDNALAMYFNWGTADCRYFKRHAGRSVRPILD
jgi:uncharacterized protein YjdB